MAWAVVWSDGLLVYIGRITLDILEFVRQGC